MYLKLIPSLTGHISCSTSECELLSLPCCLDRLGTINHTVIAYFQYNASTIITNPLKDLIIPHCEGPTSRH